MNKHGKVKQVLFEDAIVINNITGEREYSTNNVLVWTDAGMDEIIRKVKGVCTVSLVYSNIENQYSVVIDPRYDIEFVKKEIEATIICEIGEI